MGLKVKNLPAYAGDMRHAGLIPRSGRSLGGVNDSRLQYSCLENPRIYGGALQSIVSQRVR